MSKRKRNIGLILAVIYVVLSCALLISFTTAKYADVRTLFTDFRAAQFNVAIQMADLTQNNGGTETTQTLTLTDLRPGMIGQDAVRVPFCVSNGPDADTTAKVGVKYTIQILTAQYLPLEFSLEEITPVTEGENTQWKTQTYLAFEEVERIVPEDGQDHVWYQYSFPTDDATVVELNTASAQKEFELIPEVLGTYTQNQHVLVVEWPEDLGGDSVYMKEVEPIHILVTAHSVNRAEEEDYEHNNLGGNTYTEGVIFLRDGVVNTFYDVDLRAFHGTDRSFSFWIDNGFGQGMVQSKDRIVYGIDMLLPLEKVGNPGIWQKLDLSFQLDKTYTFRMEQDLCVIYNEKTDQFTRNADGSMKKFTLTEIRSMELLPEERPYGFYIGANAVLLNYMIDDTGDRVKTSNRNLHTMTMSGTGMDRITDASMADTFSFLNKAKLLITAEFKNEDPPPTTPSEDGSGSQGDGSEQTTVPDPQP